MLANAEVPAFGTIAEVQHRSQYRAVDTVAHGGLFMERHFNPAELAVIWALSPTKIRRMFKDEPGVLRVGEPSRRIGRKLKRSYYALRIPESVAYRVHQRMSK